MAMPDSILARIAVEPGVREVSFPSESTQRNFFLNDGRRWLDIHYDPRWRLVCCGHTYETEFHIDRMTLDVESLLETLNSALAWVHGRGDVPTVPTVTKAETWRTRKALL